MVTDYPGTYSTYEVRCRAVAAVSRGLPVGEVAVVYGIDRTTLFRWVTRHRELGVDGLQRKSGSGRPRLLPAFDETARLDIVR